MTDKDKLALVYRLMSGYTFLTLGGQRFVVDTPDTKLFNESLQKYEDSVYQNRYAEFIRGTDTANILFIHKQWSIISSEKELKEVEKSIDNAKLELFKLYGMPQTQITKMKLHLDALKVKRNRLVAIKHSLDEYTVEGYAEWEAETYLFERLVRDTEYNPVQVDPVTLGHIIKAYKKSLPSMTDFRLLARTDPWRSFWNINKDCF
jgi:hypothetical protein